MLLYCACAFGKSEQQKERSQGTVGKRGELGIVPFAGMTIQTQVSTYIHCMSIYIQL